MLGVRTSTWGTTQPITGHFENEHREWGKESQSFLKIKSATPSGPPRPGQAWAKAAPAGAFSHQLCLLPPSPTSLFLEFIGDSAAPAWKGYLIAVLMFLAACLQTLFEQQHMYRLKVLQIRLRTALTGLVYRKVSRGERRGPFPSPHPVLTYVQMLQPAKQAGSRH